MNQLELAPVISATPKIENPCVRSFGPGPVGVTCKTCALLWRIDGYAKIYRKCGLRANTHGAATDHKATWPACGKYRP